MPTIEEKIEHLEKVIQKLWEAELESPGVGQVSVDGNTVQYDNPQKKRLAYERELNRLKGKRQQAAQHDLSSAW